jgi:hypothetical protein
MILKTQGVNELQYSYEHWADPPPESSEAKRADDVASPQEAQSFPFVEELKELEESLSLGIEDGMEAYRRYQEARQQEPLLDQDEWDDAPAADESDWDALAKLVANHVLSYVMDNPLQAEVDKLRAQMDEMYRDNRLMAEQVQRLVTENDQLRHAAGACELELARYRQLAGNLYLKV